MSPRSPTAIRTSAEAIIEQLERVDEIGLELEHRAQRIFPQLLHPSRGRLDRELLDDELRRHLAPRSEEHTSELQSQSNLVCRLLLEKKKKKKKQIYHM